MNNYLKFFSVLLLAGCSNVQQHNADEFDHTAYNLTQAANEISYSYKELAAIAKAKSAHTGEYNVSFEHPSLKTIATLAWQGPVEMVLAEIAEISGLKFRTLGSAPAMPILVNINAKNQTLAHILKDISYQCVDFANINLLSKENVIELVYEK